MLFDHVLFGRSNPPADLTCTIEECTASGDGGHGTGFLAMATGDPTLYSEIVVTLDGVPIATLPGDATSAEIPIPPGDHVICLEATTICGDPTPPVCCAVTVIGVCESEFIRGDCNADGGMDIADAIFGLDVLFGFCVAMCDDSCDANDDATFDIADEIYGLNHLFGLGPAPLPPFPACGPDPTADALICAAFPPCP